ncbi:MAG: hypothetical protein JSR59_21800 [Proteobacteria bacterium]|nr:hypothetical protein [Pseudomonadota bacterium]
MSDGVNAVSPSVGQLVHADTASAGGKHGLGCASDTHIAACALSGDPPSPSNLVVYDGDGRRLWDDGGILGGTAATSAPLIGADGTVVAADQNWILRGDPTRQTILWKSAKPDLGRPLGPVVIGADASMILLVTGGSAAGTPEVSVWDASSGALLAHQAIVDPDTHIVYGTQNTAATTGNRAYVLTAAVDNPADGRLYAIDVCDADDCGGRGTMTIAWHYDFAGPSGASPLLIGTQVYFDGRPAAGGGTFIAVKDRGATPRLLWKKAYTGQFVAGAALDPRGGLWVYPVPGSYALLRLDAGTGNTLQTVPISAAAGLPSGYSGGSAVSVSKSAGGAVVLTLGIRPLLDARLANYVAALDVSSTATGSALWLYPVAATTQVNSAQGQFPIVYGGSGARRVVYTGTNTGTFFVGEP